ncbi:hypothetical protein [Halobellus rufus]|uniref:hypothetical protein n=1 Tax=Halobellus rufus TaxID=1448860 RepID=UPI0012E0A737|nr:hypothetical protein [Halobellus rufus]
MDANPFGMPTDDELTIVNHLQTVLLNLDPDIVQQILSDLIGEDVPRFDDWQTEVPVSTGEDPDIDVGDEVSGDTFLIGLSEQPAIITQSDLEATALVNRQKARTSEHRSMYSYVRLSIDRCTATYV